MIKLNFTDNDLVMLRGVMACSAKKDVRYYMNGFCINQQDVVATDGHRIAKFPIPENLGNETIEGNIIIPTVKIPAGTSTLTLEIDGSKVTVEQYTKKGDLSTVVLQTIDGRYPDYIRVMVERQETPLPSIAFNPMLVSEVLKVMKVYAARYVFTGKGEEGLIYADLTEYPDFTFGIMPARV